MGCVRRTRTPETLALQAPQQRCGTHATFAPTRTPQLSSIQLHLLMATIMMLSREGFRRGCLRLKAQVRGVSSAQLHAFAQSMQPAQRPHSPTGCSRRFPAASCCVQPGSAHVHAAQVLSVAWLVVPVGCLVTAAVCGAVLAWHQRAGHHDAPGSAMEAYATAVLLHGEPGRARLQAQPHLRERPPHGAMPRPGPRGNCLVRARQACAAGQHAPAVPSPDLRLTTAAPSSRRPRPPTAAGVAAVVELLSEPLYILAAVNLRFRLRALLDSAALTAKALLTLLLVAGLAGPRARALPPAIVFSAAQLAFALTTLVGYVVGTGLGELRAAFQRGGKDGEGVGAARAKAGGGGGAAGRRERWRPWRWDAEQREALSATSVFAVQAVSGLWVRTPAPPWLRSLRACSPGAGS